MSLQRLDKHSAIIDLDARRQLRRSLAGQKLSSLTGSNFEDRFFSWIGESGTIYICTVFPAGEEDNIPNIPNTIVIGVRHDEKQRSIVCFLRPNDLAACSFCDLRAASSRRRIDEWHVHFVSDYQKFCEDFSAAATCTA